MREYEGIAAIGFFNGLLHHKNGSGFNFEQRR